LEMAELRWLKKKSRAPRSYSDTTATGKRIAASLGEIDDDDDDVRSLKLYHVHHVYPVYHGPGGLWEVNRVCILSILKRDGNYCEEMW